MIKLMDKPDWIDHPSWFNRSIKENYFSGDAVINRFYYRSIGYGSLTENHIPEELENKKWVPEKDKTYKCWWYYTNPADPADPGEDILVYIEECEPVQLDNLKYDILKEINSSISKLSIDQLKSVLKHIKDCYL